MSYTHLTIEERCCLREYYLKGYSYRKIAELMPNGTTTTYYLYDDKIVINFNYKDGAKTVRVDEVKNLLLSSDSNVYALP